MTRTQLQEMSDRDLVAHARAMFPHAASSPDLIAELANRLDDRYPFNSEPQEEAP